MTRRRVREYALKPGLLPTGKHNTMADVEGVGVGHCKLIEGDDIRTGVTAITPHSRNLYEEKVSAAVEVFNGYGKSVGLSQIVNEGTVETPIMLTETLNTFRVADALIDYYLDKLGYTPRSLNSVVGETNGGYLTDNQQRRIGREQVNEAIDEALKCRGPVAEGNAGGGTPMTGYGFKGGIGTSSRKVGKGTVGVLVQLNCGRKDDLTVLGAPIGREVQLPVKPEISPGNSIMMIVATDVALESRQLWKLSKRTMLGLARTGSYSSNRSGDYSIAFTTGKLSREDFVESIDVPTVGDEFLSPLYNGVVEATEEAVLNALFKAETMQGYQGHIRYALPIEETLASLERHDLGK
ncbi:S58 family peptidase [Candidatus Bathyarchaeota archaeon]|nr:S58 family peptidase [Candidatus Bathyarchaeota archaeon]